MAALNAPYGHTNLVTRDWRRLPGFHVTLFGCQPGTMVELPSWSNAG